ncbi:MAG: hypothetical protein ACYS0G_03290 [Planctomycetota bacterium]|jgi:hypothetical protein
MMGKGLRHPLSSWIVLAAYAVSTVAVGHGVVLCQEPDGRTVIEIAADHGQCLNGLATAHTDSDGVEAGQPDCHDGCCVDCPCEDTTLAVKPAPVERESWDFLSLPPTAIEPCWAAETATVPLGRDLPVANLVTMRSLRSIVLLV